MTDMPSECQVEGCHDAPSDWLQILVPTSPSGLGRVAVCTQHHAEIKGARK